MKEIFIDDQYVVISKDDYRMLINPMMIDGVRFINRKDAAKILDVGFPTLWRWNNEGLLHAIKVGGRKVYYRYDDVLNLMKGGKLC